MTVSLKDKWSNRRLQRLVSGVLSRLRKQECSDGSDVTYTTSYYVVCITVTFLSCTTYNFLFVRKRILAKAVFSI